MTMTTMPSPVPEMSPLNDESLPIPLIPPARWVLRILSLGNLWLYSIIITVLLLSSLIFPNLPVTMNPIIIVSVGY